MIPPRDSWSNCHNTVLDSVKYTASKDHPKIEALRQDSHEIMAKPSPKRIVQKEVTQDYPFLKGGEDPLKIIELGVKVADWTLYLLAWPPYFICFKLPKWVFIDLTPMLYNAMKPGLLRGWRNAKKLLENTTNALKKPVIALASLKKGIENLIKPAFHSVLAALKGAGNKLKAGSEGLGQSAASMFNPIQAAALRIWNRAKQKGQATQETLQPGMNWFRSQVEDVSESIRQKFAAMNQKVKKGYDAVKHVVSIPFKAAANLMSENLKKLQKVAKPVVERLQEVREAVKSQAERVSNVISQVAQDVRHRVENSLAAFLKIAKVPLEVSGAALSNAKQQSSNWMAGKSLFKWVGKSNVTAKIASSFQKVTSAVMTSMERLRKDAAEKMWQVLKHGKSGLDLAKEHTKKFWNIVKEGPKKVKKSVDKAVQAVKTRFFSFIRTLRYIIAFITVLSRFTARLVKEILVELSNIAFA